MCLHHEPQHLTVPSAATVHARAAAETMLRDALELMPGALGEGAAPTMHATTQLGLVLLEKGELSEAEERLREALQIVRDALGDQHPQVRRSASTVQDAVTTAVARPWPVGLRRIVQGGQRARWIYPNGAHGFTRGRASRAHRSSRTCPTSLT